MAACVPQFYDKQSWLWTKKIMKVGAKDMVFDSFKRTDMLVKSHPSQWREGKGGREGLKSVVVMIYSSTSGKVGSYLFL